MEWEVVEFLKYLNLLVEAHSDNSQFSLASIILGIESNYVEPALLKSHLNRLHTQRQAILSLVESVDSRAQANPMNLATAIANLTQANTGQNKSHGEMIGGVQTTP